MNNGAREMAGPPDHPNLKRSFLMPPSRWGNVYLQTIAWSRLLNRWHRIHARMFIELRESRHK
jgi:hypothetical protein